MLVSESEPDAEGTCRMVPLKSTSNEGRLRLRLLTAASAAVMGSRPKHCPVGWQLLRSRPYSLCALHLAAGWLRPAQEVKSAAIVRAHPQNCHHHVVWSYSGSKRASQRHLR